MIRDRLTIVFPKTDWKNSILLSEDEAKEVLIGFNYPLPPQKPKPIVRYCGFVKLEGRLKSNAQQVIKVIESHPIVAIEDTKYPYIRYGSETSLELILSSNESDRSAKALHEKIDVLPIIRQCCSTRYANTDTWIFVISFKSAWIN